MQLDNAKELKIANELKYSLQDIHATLNLLRKFKKNELIHMLPLNRIWPWQDDWKLQVSLVSETLLFLGTFLRAQTTAPEWIAKCQCSSHVSKRNQ